MNFKLGWASIHEELVSVIISWSMWNPQCGYRIIIVCNDFHIACVYVYVILNNKKYNIYFKHHNPHKINEEWLWEGIRDSFG